MPDHVFARPRDRLIIRIILCIGVLGGLGLAIWSYSSGERPGVRTERVAKRSEAAPVVASPVPPLAWLEAGRGTVLLRGVVVDGLVPIGGVDVEVWNQRSAVVGAPVARATTDATGRFDLGNVPAVDSLILARRGELKASWSGQLSFQSDGSSAWVGLELARCHTRVSGRLVDGSGRPRAGMKLHEERFVVGASVLTPVGVADSQGRFDVCADTTLMAGAEISAPVMVPIESRVGDVVVKEPTTWRGTLLDPDRPLADALVVVAPRGSTSPVSTVSRSDGTWTVKSAPGCKQIEMYGPGQLHNLVIRCGGASEEEVVERVPLVACRELLRGTVRVQGLAAAGLRVRLNGKERLTGAAGEFSFPCPEGRLSILGHSISPSVDIPENDYVDRHVDLEARAGGRVTGLVSADGKPVPGAAVWIEPQARLEEGVAGEVAFTGLDGRFDVIAPPGPHIVHATSDGRRSTRAVAIRSNGSAKADLRLGPRRALRGVLEHGEAPPHRLPVVVRAIGRDGRPTRVIQKTRTDVMGRFELDVAPGRYRLSIDEENWSLGDGPGFVDVDVGEVEGLDLSVNAWRIYDW